MVVGFESSLIRSLDHELSVPQIELIYLSKDRRTRLYHFGLPGTRHAAINHTTTRCHCLSAPLRHRLDHAEHLHARAHPSCRGHATAMPGTHA